ncbi:hypothetical protein [Desertimonas flava]|uniref:hypothetical protein n=1 Tax=Desertimonas flava TaxID=2064846 RepID=UPI000E34368A|nr:hypothetical protein [Desertimonas flava]
MIPAPVVELNAPSDWLIADSAKAIAEIRAVIARRTEAAARWKPGPLPVRHGRYRPVPTRRRRRWHGRAFAA